MIVSSEQQRICNTDIYLSIYLIKLKNYNKINTLSYIQLIIMNEIKKITKLLL